MSPTKTVWVAGEQVTAASINGYASTTVSWGVVGVASITASSAAFTTVADIGGLTVTFTAPASRTYKIGFCGNYQSTVASDAIDIFITDGAGTQMYRYRSGLLGASNTESAAMFVTATPAAGSTTYKIRAARVVGTGSCTIQASATIPATLIVEDVGPA